MLSKICELYNIGGAVGARILRKCWQGPATEPCHDAASVYAVDIIGST